MLRFFAALAALLAAAGAQALENPFPKAGGAYLVLRDGEPIWGAGTDRSLQPASLAKMMTALLELESGRPAERVVAIGKAAAGATGKRMGLRAGERYRASDLLAAAVIASANDACRALADDLGGTRTAFIARMNERAAALGMSGTRFADPCGHDQPGQHTTAADMAKLAQAVATHPRYMGLAGLARTKVQSADGKREIALVNTNALIRYKGVIGLKTGYTPKAGRCLAALAERDGVRVLLVILDGSDRWWDAAAMIERAFSWR